MHLPRTSAPAGAPLFYAAVLLLLICEGVYPARGGTFVVTTVADPGDGICTPAGIGDGCTLREAILAANGAPGPDTIDATGVTGTIQLTGVLPDLSTDIDINGPGATALIVRRNTGGDYRIFNVSVGVTVKISGLTVTNGQALNGVDGIPTAPLVPYRGTSGEAAGGIFNSGTLSLTDVDVSENQSGHGGNSYRDVAGLGGSGGGIYNAGMLIVTRCSVSRNQTGYGGAGASGSGGSGAGIYNNGTLMMTESTVSGNQTGNGGDGGPAPGGGPPGGTGGYGGGIFNAGSATLVNTTVSANLTGKGGGTMFGNDSIPGLGGGISNGGTLILNNSTISGNKTGEDPLIRSYTGGGGIYGAGQMTITNTTITNNGSVNGGGIYLSGTATLGSSIVAGNSAFLKGPDIFGMAQSVGYNLIGDGRDAIITPNPGAGPDLHGPANLNPLAHNGGPTLTHLPRRDSPAIDNGKNFGGTNTDQRGDGFARTVDLADDAYPNAADGTDIGAVELAGVSAVAGNISTRARIETGDNAMIAGFIITGTAPKKILVRGLGPSLQDAGVAGFLADPVLELRGSNGVALFGSDNWQDNPQQAAQVHATGLAPTRSLESAVVAELVPEAYTVVVRGTHNTSGVGLAEVYDLEGKSELVNVSTRGLVQSQDNVMIGGFTLGPGVSTNLVLRALGPSLTSAGIQNALADPTLDVRDANGDQIAFNDNWQDDQAKAAQVIAKGLAPTNNNECAVPLTLPPGQYTAIVRGRNNGVGVGIVEIYNTH